MKKNKLGNTQLEVTEICLGTMTWGHQNTEEDAHEQLDYAIKEAGINFIDTAELYCVPPSKEAYGSTERYIGTWLTKNPGIRGNLIIASKMAGIGVNWIREGRGAIAQEMEEAVNGSLERLQTNYIDLYQLHWPQRGVNKFGKMNYDESMCGSKEKEEEHILGILQAFDALRKQGKVNFLGLSNETPWGVMKFLEIAEKYKLPKVQTVQNPYSILQRQVEVGLSEVCMYEYIGLLAYSPLMGGILTGKYQDGNMPVGSRYELWGRERHGQYFNERTLGFVSDLEKISTRLGMTVGVLALAWVNNRSFVHSNIIGATSLEQLKENISSVNYVLEPEIIGEIDALFTKNPNPGTF